MIKVLVAEDQNMIRDALVALLVRDGEIEVVAEAADGEEAVELALQIKPDVAILDLDMPGRDGLWAAEQLHQRLASCRVLILTVFDRPGYLRRALESGAAGFLLKGSRANQLLDAVRRIAAGERVVDPKLAVTALTVGANPLTAREREALAMSLDGSTIEAIAAKLHLTTGTVRTYLSVAIQKMSAQNRVEAARIAEEKGWL